MKPLNIAGHQVNPLILLGGGGAVLALMLMRRHSAASAAAGAPIAQQTTDPTGVSGSDLVTALMAQVQNDQGNVSALTTQLQGLQASLTQLQSGTQPTPAPAPSAVKSVTGFQTVVVGTNPVPGGYGLWGWNGGSWSPLPGGAVQTWADALGNQYALNAQHQIYEWDKASSNWAQLPGSATAA